MCRLACNVCGVTTVNGSSVGSSSCCRLSTRCSLPVISPDRPSTEGVLAFLWILHVFCLDHHQPICESVCVGRKRPFTTSHHIFFLPRSTAVFLLLHGITSTSVDGRPLCSHLPGEHTISPTTSPATSTAAAAYSAYAAPAVPAPAAAVPTDS